MKVIIDYILESERGKSVCECNQYYYMDNDFFNIIREEAEVYYTGQKKWRGSYRYNK